MVPVTPPRTIPTLAAAPAAVKAPARIPRGPAPETAASIGPNPPPIAAPTAAPPMVMAYPARAVTPRPTAPPTVVEAPSPQATPLRIPAWTARESAVDSLGSGAGAAAGFSASAARTGSVDTVRGAGVRFSRDETFTEHLQGDFLVIFY